MSRKDEYTVFEVVLCGVHEGRVIASYPTEKEAKHAKYVLVEEAKTRFVDNWYNKTVCRPKEEIYRDIELEIGIRARYINPLNDETLISDVDRIRNTMLNLLKKREFTY